LQLPQLRPRGGGGAGAHSPTPHLPPCRTPPSLALAAPLPFPFHPPASPSQARLRARGIQPLEEDRRWEALAAAADGGGALPAGEGAGEEGEEREGEALAWPGTSARRDAAAAAPFPGGPHPLAAPSLQAALAEAGRAAAARKASEAEVEGGGGGGAAGSGGVEGQQWLLVRPRLRCERLVADAPHGGGVWC